MIEKKIQGRQSKHYSRTMACFMRLIFVVNLGGILNLIYEFPSVMQNFGGKYDGKVPLERVKEVRQLLNQILRFANKKRIFNANAC